MVPPFCLSPSILSPIIIHSFSLSLSNLFLLSLSTSYSLYHFSLSSSLPFTIFLHVTSERERDAISVRTPLLSLSPTIQPLHLSPDPETQRTPIKMPSGYSRSVLSSDSLSKAHPSLNPSINLPVSLFSSFQWSMRMR